MTDFPVFLDSEERRLFATDIAWVAGIIEGEGCITSKYWSIRVVMTDHDVVEKLANIMKAKLYGPYTPKSRIGGKNGPWKPVWEIHLSGPRSTGWMMTIYSFMGERRRKAIEESLKRWKLGPGRGVYYHTPRRISVCHPNRLHRARGLCGMCYHQYLRAKWKLSGLKEGRVRSGRIIDAGNQI